MKELVSTYFNLIFRIGLILVLIATLFLFSNLTTDFYDTPKFIALLVFCGLLLILTTIKYTIQNRVIFVRTPLDVPLLLLLIVSIVSTFLSNAPYISALGNQARVFGSLVSWVLLLIFYFLVTNSIKGLREIRFIFYLSLILGSILSILSLLSYFGVKYLPAPWNQGQSFTTTGLSFSTTAILALLLPLPIMEILRRGEEGGSSDIQQVLGLARFGKIFKGLTAKTIYCLILILFGLTIVLTGHISAIIAAIFTLILTVVVARPNYRHLNIAFLGVPVVLVGLVATLSFMPPVAGFKTPLYDLAQSYPREVQLDFVSAWKVSVSSFRDQPFWGTGPATYLFDFTSYKPIEFNSTKFWNIRFDSSFNEYLQILATLGGIGLLGLISLAAMFVSSTYKVFASYSPPLTKALGISGITFFVILLFHSATLPLWIFGLLVLGSFSVINLLSGASNVYSLGSNLKDTLLRIVQTSVSQTSEAIIKFEALPGVLLVIALAVTLSAFFFGGKLILADYHHRQALDAVSKNDGLKAYNELIESERLNPVNDLYRTDLAQVNFALANAIALSKGPTEASPAGSFTDQDRQNIQVLLQQSINEARSAVALSPRSTINWEILATLYRQIAGVAENALVFSLDSYGRAIFQDPLNPLLRLNVGGTYYAIQNYDLAIRFFTDAINLKPDFANGYYNLSVALRDKGDLNSALQAAERMITLIDASSADYKVASDYLSDLKNKITPSTPAEPPAATASGALQEQQLPNVVDVGNPPKNIATPSAVKRPNSTPEPTPNP